VGIYWTTARDVYEAWAIYALVLWRESLLQNENRKTWLHLASLACALIVAVFLRPDNGLIAASLLPAVFWIAWQRIGLKRAVSSLLLCSIIFLVPLVPWTIRNKREFGLFQPLSPRQANDPDEFVTYGFNLWCSTWEVDYASTEEVYWAPQINSIDINDLPARAFDSPQQRDDTAAIISQYNDGVANGTADTPEVDAKFMALAKQRIHTNPLRSRVLLPLARVANMWLRPRVEQYDYDLHWWNYPDHPQETLTALALGALNIFNLALAIVGWVRLQRHDAILLGLAALIVLRCMLLYTLDNSEPRYTIVCFPILFLLGAAAFLRRENTAAQ
jgi:hypothetical protein